MKKIISEINSILSEKIRINPKEICIYGFSGGQDSVLLFIILLHLKEQWNIKIQLLHFHHFWQQKNFFSTYHVWYLSFVFRKPIYIITSEVFLNTEKKARQWRQQGFQRISDLEKSTKIFTGHTASDRIETALWHLIRGTSPQGLISVKWQTILLVETESFSFPKLFVFHSFETKKLTKTQISLDYKSFKRIDINKYQISKFTSIYKKSKNKKTFRSNLSKEKKSALIPISVPKNLFIPCAVPKTSFLEKQAASAPKNKLKQYQLSCVLFKKLTKTLLIYTITKKKSKREIYKKNKKKVEPFCFLIFSSCILTPIFFEKNQQTIYCFLIFNLFFSKKNILRPLLVLHRNDITFFSKKYLLPIICDPSNQKVRWSRNRIRHQLLPVLRFFFNTNTEYLLNNFLEINIEEQKYIESVIKKLIKYWLNQYENYYEMKIQLELFPKAIQRRLLQKIFQSYTNLQPNLLQVEILRRTINKNF